MTVVAVSTPLARKLGTFVPLSPAELARLDRLRPRSRRFAAGSELIHERERARKAFILQEGWTAAYKLLGDGGRQVIDFQLPGDFVGLRSLLLRGADHSVVAVTGVVAHEITMDEIVRTFDSTPRLLAAMLWAASRDEAMVVEHLVDVGRRRPLARLAHYMLELHHRLHLVGHAEADRFACPLSQPLLADALGLSAVHLNRVLRQLRERGLMTFRGGRVTIHDLAGLETLAGFDRGYLDPSGIDE